MAQFVSARQFRSGIEQEKALPVIVPGNGLEIQHRVFSSEFKYHYLLQDVYEVTNTTWETLPHFLIPGGESTILIPIGSGKRSKPLFCGTLTSMHRIMIPPRSAVFVARLRDGSGEWLAGDKIAELTDHFVPLANYLPEADLLQRQMRYAESYHERMLQLVHVFGDHNGHEYRPVAAMERSIQIIYKTRGNIAIADIAKTVGCSDRYLNKLFRRYLGISTKHFAEVIQLQYSLNTILTTNPRSLLQVAVDYGYFDQAHMNRYYKKFLKCTASDMRMPERNTEAAMEIPLFA